MEGDIINSGELAGMLGNYDRFTVADSNGTNPMTLDDLKANLWFGLAPLIVIVGFTMCVCGVSSLYRSRLSFLVGDDDPSTEETDDQQTEELGESLPTYTAATGLPSYEEAVELQGETEQIHDGAEQPTQAENSETGNTSIGSEPDCIPIIAEDAALASDEPFPLLSFPLKVIMAEDDEK